MTLGRHLRTLRKAATKTVAEVCAELGVPKPTLYMWEGPRSRPDPVDIRRMCALYNAKQRDITKALELRSLPRDEVDPDGPTESYNEVA